MGVKAIDGSDIDSCRAYGDHVRLVERPQFCYGGHMEEHGWISVDERLPEQDAALTKNGKLRVVKVLVAIRARNGWTVRTQERFLDYDGKEWVWRYAAGTLTHWMPLPEPPTEAFI